MDIYLPIAELSVNLFAVLGIGGMVGFLSGMFGVGGGFLMTPLLIMLGVPPAVAVATQASQIAASSFSGMLVHIKRRSLDTRLGTVLLVGGLGGSGLGVILFTILQRLGQLDLIIAVSYVVFLGVVGSLMLAETARSIMRARRTGRPADLRRHSQHHWVLGLPFKMRFKTSKLYVSAIPVLALGAFIGVLVSIMGVGGGFIMVPAMIYLLKVPTNVVIGTSLYQIMFVTAFTAIAQAWMNHTVDVILAVILMVGGAFGAQFGAQIGQRLRGEHLRGLLALIVLGVGLVFLVELVVTPEETYSLSVVAPEADR